jgi:MFS family permease
VPLLYHTVGLSFPLLLLLMFCGALFDSPGGTARQSMAPELAERAGIALERVNSAYQTIFAVTGLVGPPLAGVLIAWLGASNVLWLDAVSFAISALLIGALTPFVAGAATAGGSYLADAREGLRFAWNDRLMRTVALLALGINFITNPVFGVMMPVYAKEIFGSPKALGIMMSGFGCGALAGSLAYGWFGPRLAGRRMVVLTIALIALPVALLAFLPPLWAVFALNALVGIGSGMVNPFIVTVFQRRTPLALRGRVLGTFVALAMLASPLGVLIGGALIQAIGLRSVLAIAGATLCLFALMTPFLRVLGELDRPAEPAIAPE